MTTRLDEIEQCAKHVNAPWMAFDYKQILELVAVARAGIKLRDALADRQDMIPEHLHRAEQEHIAALAPLLEEVK
jgi:hypothetical protein